MSRLVDLAGQRFGRMSVLERVPNGGGNASWLCRCDCGNERVVRQNNLRRGATRSCGCARKIRSPSNGKTIDLTGQRFERLVVLRLSTDETRQLMWTCLCDCGQEKDVRSDHLRRGLVLSCGCFGQDARTIHGHVASGSKAYKIWCGMRDRCLNPDSQSFRRYGGRGIGISDRWRDSFDNFLADMGEPPAGLSIDRIDNDGNYEPGNCRWATPAEQQRNRGATKLDPASVSIIRYSHRRGVSMADLAREFGVSPATIDDVVKRRTWRDPLKGLSGVEVAAP